MRPEISPTTSIVTGDPAESDRWARALAPWVSLVDPSEADVLVVPLPVDGPPSRRALAIVDAGGLDARALFAQGWRGVLGADAPPERVAAALVAIAAGLQVQEPESVARGGPPELTPREIEVLELLAQGLSNREIGDALGISSHTAKFHVQGLLDKLDATTRTEAAVRAARWSLV